MDSQIVAIYCICDDMLKGLKHYEDPQRKMSDAEVLTTSLVAALFFGGNMEKARIFLQEYGYIPKMLEKSRFNRRQHKITELFLVIFELLGDCWKELNEKSVYIMDSFPISACDNYRIARCHLYEGEAWRGYQASKKRYFYGLKIHLMVTEQGQPVEFFLTPGSWSDTRALKMYNFDLPEGSLLTGDKAYNDYAFEDMLELAGLDLLPLRKKNSHRPLPPWLHYLMACYRKVIETTGSLLERLLPKHIHAVTPHGFELKLAIFVLATSFNCLNVAT
jgi:Transposase DDE domain